MKDGGNLSRNDGLELLSREVMPDILLAVELAAVPETGVAGGAEGRSGPGVVASLPVAPPPRL